MRPGVIVPALLFLVASSAQPAAAEGERSSLSLIQASFAYDPYDDAWEAPPPSISFRRNEARAVEAPSRFSARKRLSYTKTLGRSGLIFRVKAPLKKRKLVKFELKF